MYVWQIIQWLKTQGVENAVCYVLVDLGSISELFQVSGNNMLLKMADYDTDMFINAYVNTDNILVVG